jgi:hypothetical protein
VAGEDGVLVVVLAIDPGPTESAWVLYSDGVIGHGKNHNTVVLDDLRRLAQSSGRFASAEMLVVEMVASYGMPVGVEVFETVLWTGRFVEACWLPHALIYRKDVKMHLCGQTAKVNDAVIRQALIDRFGPSKRKAIGTQMAKGPLWGIKGDEWQALAVAVTWADKNARKEAA